MAEIICIIGTKGGTGKTTLSHLLCHGLGLLGRRTACVMTDEYRDPLPPQGRRYIMADARSPQARTKVVEKLKELPGWMGVLDGGANRTDTDISLYEMSDLVLLPFRDSPEDLRTVMHDLELFPRAFALPSQWPKNKWQKEAAAKLIATMPADMQDRVLSPTYAVSASKLLLQSTPPEALPAALNNAAKAVACQVIDILGDDVAAVEASLREAAA
ncbi:hypothetical protein ACDA63_10430 [Uliginosibacterium sp. sgz301328]|uniref:hypothetical protein n=1 Tax=Uliginosibacterium sp. sgz301328 TaxID=3243764 RepID=UPI00359EED79